MAGQCPGLNEKKGERCGKCGIAHFGIIKTCPNLADEVQLRILLDDFEHSVRKRSPEIAELLVVLIQELANATQRRRRRKH